MLPIRAASILLITLFAGITSAAELTTEQRNFFESKIHPVLIRECYGCHSNKAGNVRGGLRLDTKQLTLLGGGSGPAVVPGDLDESLLYNAITHQDFEMPPNRKLPQTVIADFRKWIEMGAPDPREKALGEIQSKVKPEDIQQAKENFWAYQKPVKHPLPQVQHQDWAKTDIDRFVLARLEQAGLQPAEDADAETVLRRLCFDLNGLPPTPEQIAFFKKGWQQDPDRAIAYVVDRLLEKPQYGERWGRHWLDVARYAESTGRTVNMTFPEAWRYRDYVIDSFNEDKPFDRFVMEQLAGDLLSKKSDEEFAKNLVATTFLAIGSKDLNEANRIQFRANLIDEQIDATTRVFLGTSVACARCHDHKFDPIPQADYYAMAGVFQSMETFFGNPQSEYGAFQGLQERQTSTLLVMPIDDPSPGGKSLSDSELQRIKDDLEDKKSQLVDLRRSSSNPMQLLRQRAILFGSMSVLSNQIASVDQQGKPYSFCMGVQEVDRPTDARLLVRGEIDQPAQQVPRGFLQVLSNEPAKIGSNESGRLQLAEWIASEENPLTARVMVNRIWQHLLGQGIVSSTENFGSTGQSPSHPELLDQLSTRFVDSGWSVKTMIREIVTSRVYRMKSTFNESFHEIDPENQLLWRANPKRLDAEAIRDAMLAISDEIDLDRPHASIVAKAGYTRVANGQLRLPQDTSAGMMRGPFGGGMGGGRFGGRFGRIDNPLQGEKAKVRSVYLPVVRDEEPRSLSVFDFADSSGIIGTRETSNTANQSLYMMNNPFVIQQSEAFAKRIAEQSSSTDRQVELAFVMAYGRPATDSETKAAESFLRKFIADGASRSKALAMLCQSLFASAEFRYLD
ncbi:DUF1553 domain-containing protein [bacterium]|nr:DUF1553 domain-containing protein [bacterium]